MGEMLEMLVEKAFEVSGERAGAVAQRLQILLGERGWGANRGGFLVRIIVEERPGADPRSGGDFFGGDVLKPLFRAQSKRGHLDIARRLLSPSLA